MWYEPKDRVLQFGRWSQYVDFVRRLSTDSDLYVSIMAAIRDIEQGLRRDGDYLTAMVHKMFDAAFNEAFEQGPDGVEEIGGGDD